MLEYERIHVLEGIDVNKSNKSKEYDLCHNWYFIDKNFDYEPYLCNGSQDLMQKKLYVLIMLQLFLSKEIFAEFISVLWVKMMLLIC